MTSSQPLPVVERTGVSVLDPAALPRSSWALDDLSRLTASSRAPLAPLVRWQAGAVSVSLVHEVPAAAVPLAALLAVRALDVPHAVSVGVGVGTALQALHDAGLAHGSVDGEHVLVAPDGSVVLTGAGLAWRAAPGAPEGPHAPDDVADLGVLLRGLLGARSAPAPIVVAALRATDPDPSVRPSAADLVAAVLRCGDPEPLPYAATTGLPAAAAPAPPAAAVPPRPGARPRTAAPPSTSVATAVERAPSEAGDRRSPRALRVARRVVVLLAVLVAGGAAVRAVPVQLAGASPAPAPASPMSSPPANAAATAPEPVAADWTGVLAALDEGRRRALESGSEADLALWVDPDGEAWAHDRALQRRLASSGASLAGGGLVLEQVVAEEVTADRAVLAVRDRRTAYDVVEGGRRTRVPERPAQWWTVVLTAVPSLDGDGWRVAEVRSAADRAAP